MIFIHFNFLITLTIKRGHILLVIHTNIIQAEKDKAYFQKILCIFYWIQSIQISKGQLEFVAKSGLFDE